MEKQLEFQFVTQASSLPMPAAKKANASTTEQQRDAPTSPIGERITVMAPMTNEGESDEARE
jgi:hypothetical protein